MYVLLIFDLDQLTCTSFELEGINGCNPLMGHHSFYWFRTTFWLSVGWMLLIFIFIFLMKDAAYSSDIPTCSIFEICLAL